MDPRRWFVITVQAPSEELMDELAGGLVALGGAAVEVRGTELETYLLPDGEPEEMLARARELLEGIAGGRRLEIGWRWQEDQDWSALWKQGLRPRRVGRRLIVAPSWTRPKRRRGDIVIVIDPQMAFGTGEHASTRGALRMLEDMVRPSDRVLDVGTGSAVLAIAAAKLGAAEVLGVDNDADAIINAAENVERNGVAGRVVVEHGHVDPAYLDHLGSNRFDVIVANVLSGVLIPLLPAFRRSLAEGGRLILGGILEQEAPDVVAAASDAGLVLRASDTEQEWWTGLFGRLEDMR
ncbi:MAG TPA: 50S ribosomal protein L11 methyltransferase [Longimicrobiales bacterium]|nr:50S ribosomal protein L11 methyltransferase [Longimicrobiales bacterium]